MTHINLSEPEVVLLVVSFVLLREYGALWGSNNRGLDIDSLEVKVSEAVKGKSRKGMIQ
jgi:hypothetical protein